MCLCTSAQMTQAMVQSCNARQRRQTKVVGITNESYKNNNTVHCPCSCTLVFLMDVNDKYQV